MTPTRKPLKRVGRDASLHPATVSKATATANVVPFRPARGGPAPQRQPVAIDTTTVNPLVWKTALRLAGGDATRIRVVDAATVRVVNQSRR